MHPLLLAAFPVIFLFAQNTNDQPSLSALWGPLLVAVDGAALVLLAVLGLSRAVGASLQRAALALSLVIGLVMTYGHAWNRGYRYLHVGSIRGPTASNAAADEAFLYTSTTEFGSILTDTTLLRALEHVAPQAFALGLEELHAAQTDFQLRTLNDLADAPGRNFVFAHLLIPHPPFAFNADGSRVTGTQRASRTIEEQYVEHVRFTNASLLALVDRLHAGPSETWPIIVIAADEGPFPDRYAEDEDNFQWLEARPDELLGKFSILTAISVPGVDRAGLEAAGFTDDMTLVNLFRIVFNAAFDADLPMLPHRNWVFVDQLHIYDAVDVSDRLPS